MPLALDTFPTTRIVPLTPTSLPRVEVPGLYVHVPFCFHKCHYCDFYSITRQTPERMAAFVDRVLREADVWLVADAQAIRPRTVFFGGGTPSLLPVDAMDRLLAGLRERFDFSRLDEWTVEVNPATADGDYLRMLRLHGVDRISMGAQSFDRAELATLERHHDPDDVPRGVELVRAAGIGRCNVDLIYAIPGQSLASWARSLDAALGLGVRHVSAYGLTYEPNTPMGVRHRLGGVTATPDDDELAMLRHARDRLTTAGLPPYEVSNYAAPAEACRHNLMYWSQGDYVGLGPGAASHVGGVRFRNRPHLGEWERAVDAGALAATDVERLTPTQRAGERMMLGLRLAAGVDRAAFRRDLGADPVDRFGPTVERLVSLGLVEVTPAAVRLTDAGLPVTDAVTAEFVDVSGG